MRSRFIFVFRKVRSFFRAQLSGSWCPLRGPSTIKRYCLLFHCSCFMIEEAVLTESFRKDRIKKTDKAEALNYCTVVLGRAWCGRWNDKKKYLSQVRALFQLGTVGTMHYAKGIARMIIKLSIAFRPLTRVRKFNKEAIKLRELSSVSCTPSVADKGWVEESFFLL